MRRLEEALMRLEEAWDCGEDAGWGGNQTSIRQQTVASTD